MFRSYIELRNNVRVGIHKHAILNDIEIIGRLVSTTVVCFKERITEMTITRRRRRKDIIVLRWPQTNCYKLGKRMIWLQQ